MGKRLHVGGQNASFDGAIIVRDVASTIGMHRIDCGKEPPIGHLVPRALVLGLRGAVARPHLLLRPQGMWRGARQYPLAATLGIQP